MKKIILFVLLISVVVIPATAINFDYESYASYDLESYTNTGSSVSTSSDFGTNLYFSNIESWNGVKCVVYSITGYTVRDPELITSEIPVTFKISSTAIGSGMMQLTHHSSGTGTLAVFFDSFDVSGYSGAKTVTCDFEVTDFNLKWSSFTWDRAVTNPNDVPLLEIAYTAKYPRIKKATGYIQIDFHQSLEYTQNDDGTIDYVYYRNDQTNFVNVTDNSGIAQYTNTKGDDISYTGLYDIPYTVYVDNPFVSSGDYDSWTITMPETAGPSSFDPAEFTAYIYDAQTGNLITWSQLNKTEENYGTTTTLDDDGVVQDVVYWDEAGNWTHFTATATGYQTDTTGFNYTAETAPPGSSNQMTFHLVPDGSLGNNSYALSFMVHQEISPSSEIYTPAIDATVICDGEQHITGPSGTTWFNVTAGEHAYTVAKNGFASLQGTATVSDGNMLQTVYLHLGPDVPTVDNTTGGGGGDDGDPIHQGIEETYAQFGEIIPGGLMLICMLFIIKVITKA